MNKRKSVILIFFTFVYFLLCLIFTYNVYSVDSYINYSFSYALRIGEVAYKDFNLIVPIFSPFLYSLFLLFSKSMFFFYMGQASLLTLMFCFIYKYIKEKSLIILFILSLPILGFSMIYYPSYNFLFLFIVLGLIMLEESKINHKDKLIGLLTGILVITKHTLGILFFIPSLIYLFKDKKIFFKRLKFSFIPIGSFIIYLIVTNSFKEFINLGILGLFDFSKSNFESSLILIILTLLIILYSIFKFIKTKNIKYIYLLLFSFIVIPIFDYYHFVYLAVLFLIVLFSDLKFNLNNFIRKILVILIFIIPFSFTYLQFNIADLKLYKFNNIYRVMNKDNYKIISSLNEYLDSSKKEIIYLCGANDNMFFKIINNKEIGYYDLLNYGNYGYDGTKKVINKLKKEKDVLFVLEKGYIGNSNTQYIQEASNYVMDNSKKVYENDAFFVYYKE